jgi:hypothetical protein
MLKSFDGTVHYLFEKGIQVTVFTVCRTYVSQESFLKKSVRKRCLETRAFVYSLAHLDVSFRVSIYERLSAHNSARVLKMDRNCILMRGTVNRSADNRGSTLHKMYNWFVVFIILAGIVILANVCSVLRCTYRAHCCSQYIHQQMHVL